MRNRLLPRLLVTGGLGVLALAAAGVIPPGARLGAQTAPVPVLKVPAVADFAVTGRGDATAWNAVPWTTLNARGGASNAPATRMKVAWSATGLYVLMDAADTRLTATYEEDFADLW